MELKNLLNINLLIIVFLSFSSCKSEKDNNETETKEIDANIKKDTTLNLVNNTINDTINNDKGINNTEDINKNTSAKVIKEPSDEYIYNGEVHYGLPNPDSVYIMFPNKRINDSIGLFVNNYDSFMRSLTKKGMGHSNKPIKDPIKRDSLLWDVWQKMIKQNDYRHQYVPFDRNTMKFGTKK